jgi:hypothetical protein
MLDVPAEFDFLSEKSVASPAVFGDLVGKVGFVRGGEICCGNKGSFVRHSELPDEGSRTCVHFRVHGSGGHGVAPIS